MSIVTTLSSAAILANPDLLIPEQRAGHLIYLYDLDRTVAPDFNLIKQLIAEEEEAADMVSLSKDTTGIDNVIFVSTKYHGRHAPRIKIAVDPPDKFSATGKNTTMQIHDYATVGEPLPRHIFEQAKQFIERNHAALLDYWNAMIGWLKPPR